MPNNIFSKIIHFLDNTETSFVTLLAKIIPFLVPVIPAYVGYTHVTNKVTGLGFDTWAGWVYGAVIEGLGYAAIYKAVQFWENNRRYSSEKNQSPLTMAVIIYVVYLVVTLTVNVVLDWQAGVEPYKVVAIGLISLLSVPAGLLMSISAIHTERTNEREQENERKKAERRESRENERRTNAEANERTPNEQPIPIPTNEHRTPNERPIPMPTNEQRTPNERPFGFQSNEKSQRLFAHIEQLQANGQQIPGPSELARQLDMSKSYISERLKEWRGE
jgi:putative Mn2+ efflux pump MntP